MKRREGRRASRFIALVTSLVLVAGLMPLPAFADAGNSGGGARQGGAAELLAAGNVLAAQGDGRGDAGISGADLIKKLVEAAAVAAIDPEEAATMGAEWAAELFCEEVLGISAGDANDAVLREILAGIEELKKDLNALQKTANSQELDQILNSLIPLLSKQTTSDVYASLAGIDASEATPELKEQKRISAVTDDLGIDEGHWGSVENTYDDFAWELWTAMTQPYHVTMNGEAQDLTLLQIHYEHLRAKYHWEHQAYAEWEAYQTQCVGLLMTTLNLEKHSLQARIELLKQKHPERDTGAVESRLKKIQDCINQAAGYKGKDANGNEVDYPGLFSDKTRANQYWMYKQRDGGERYYWTPGHEILFYTQVNTQNVPQENPKAGVGSNNAIKLLRGVSWQKSRTSESYLPYAKFSFWKPFIRYKGGDTLLASADQLKTIYKDYGGSKHLYDIFIGEDEGNFQGLVVGNNTKWWFVVDPDSKHQLEYIPHLFRADQIRCSLVKSADASDDHAVLCYYHNSYSEPNGYTHYIGIGVKYVGKVTTVSGGDAPQADGMACTKVVYDSALWWPSCGNLEIGYDSGTQGSVLQATVDETPIDASAYTTSSNAIVLSEPFMSDLSFGEHVLKLSCAKGVHTVEFSVKQRQAIAVKGTVAKTYGDKVFNVGAKASGALRYGSSNKRVVMVDGDGDVILRGAGTAKITVAASETDDYAPATATVTVKVAKAKNPVTLVKKTIKAKHSQLKKSNKAYAINKAKKAQGKVTYSITKAVKGKKSFKRKFSINKKTGKITVKKGIAKGAYKVTVKAAAKGNANYKPGSKAAVITIKVT